MVTEEKLLLDSDESEVDDLEEDLGVDKEGGDQVSEPLLPDEDTDAAASTDEGYSEQSY